MTLPTLKKISLRLCLQALLIGTTACATAGTSTDSKTGILKAQEPFTLSSPVIKDGGMMPADLKCTRNGGDGASPPLTWSAAPEGTESLAVIMHHYPRNTTEGVDAPSQYWLLWNIPADITGLDRGNPLSIGTEGSDKDGRTTGYTPPCSPSGQQHKYTIAVYALNGQLEGLPTDDDKAVDWKAMTDAMQGKIISSSQFDFFN